MTIFYVQIDVVFGKPLKIVGTKKWGKDNRVRGFIQEIGCTAASEELMIRIIIDYTIASDKHTDPTVHFERIGVIKARDAQREIYGDRDINSSLKQNPMEPGIWYATGKGFYS